MALPKFGFTPPNPETLKIGPPAEYMVREMIGQNADPVLVADDGSVSREIYPGSYLKGGFTVLDLPTREEAVAWARKIAIACRCAQELREFMYDPAV